MPTTFTVDIADFKVTAQPESELVTYSLGSCIGVAIWDYETHVGGLIHYMLGDSKIAPTRARQHPAMFADTGLPLLFRSAYALGAEKRRLVVKVAGGAKLFESSHRMDIGYHNYTMLRKIFWKNSVLIDTEHTGGQVSRTMRLDVDTGRVTIENRRLGCIDL